MIINDFNIASFKYKPLALRKLKFYKHIIKIKLFLELT